MPTFTGDGTLVRDHTSVELTRTAMVPSTLGLLEELLIRNE